jgi:hypothetical protein
VLFCAEYVICRTTGGYVICGGGGGYVICGVGEVTDDWMWHVDRIYYNMIEVGLG